MNVVVLFGIKYKYQLTRVRPVIGRWPDDPGSFRQLTGYATKWTHYIYLFSAIIYTSKLTDGRVWSCVSQLYVMRGSKQITPLILPTLVPNEGHLLTRNNPSPWYFLTYQIQTVNVTEFMPLTPTVNYPLEPPTRTPRKILDPPVCFMYTFLWNK